MLYNKKYTFGRGCKSTLYFHLSQVTITDVFYDFRHNALVKSRENPILKML